MAPNDKISALLLHGISIIPFLLYNPYQDLAEGFEDFVHFGRTNTASNSALVFMNIRNNLLSNGFRVGDAKICWSYISRLYKIDSKSPIRLCPELIQRHIVLKNFSKLRVNLAVHILSHSIAADITTMVNFSTLPPEAISTAHFAENFDQLFDCFKNKAHRSKQVICQLRAFLISK
ncbi:transposable element p transposase [Plakobranchus ocellatus]|uniref:Transposable element p transposase n=1 Tax=Plakobranchus ocellatus TaxID=259542 RepID=A0AAV4BYG0_9GAST|nr:transposable element p transposase [Plakobranchus ocellatus]